MAAGALARGLIASIVASSSALLSGASEPMPTSDASHVGAGSSAGARAAGAPIATGTVRAGVRAPLHDGQWFDRIHVLPRSASLGNLPGDRTLSVEVWNAHRRGLLLWTVPVTGSPGVSVGAGTLAREYQSLHSELFTVSVSVSGTDPIDNMITWTFRARTGASTYVAVTTPGADLTLSGVRILVFSPQPNWDEAVTELYGYLCDVQTSRNGTEQRRALRETPTRELDFTTALLEPRAITDAMSRLFEHGMGVFAMPFWPDQVSPGADVGIGATSITVDTVGRAFVAAGTAVLWRDQFTFEVVTIDQVFSDHLTLANPTAAAWPAAGTLCLPVLPARLLQAPSLERVAGNAADLAVSFSAEAA